MKKAILTLFTLSALISACGPTESDIAATLAETEVAIAATQAALLPPTSIVEPTPTPDLRIITDESRNFLCNEGDMPEAGNYDFPGPEWIKEIPNSEVLSLWGQEEGQAYIDETGRIEGWVIWHSKGAIKETLPEEIYCNVVRYESAEGAYITASKYIFSQIVEDERSEEITLDQTLGDYSYAFIAKEPKSNNTYLARIDIVFTYRNYYVRIQGTGWDKDVHLEDVLLVAQNVLQSLEAAPLTSP